jgi:hypothetical protein
MKVALFLSEKDAGLFAFTVDETGANLPSDLAPWNRIPIRPATEQAFEIANVKKHRIRGCDGPKMRWLLPRMHPLGIQPARNRLARHSLTALRQRAVKGAIDVVNGDGAPIVQQVDCAALLIVRAQAVAVLGFWRFLSRTSRNQKGKLLPSAVRANLDDPPIHIRPIVPASAGAKEKNHVGSCH